MISQVIGNHFRTVRTEHELTQVEACRVINVDQSALSRIENGKQMLTAAQWATFLIYVDEDDDLVDVVKHAFQGKESL